MDVVVGLRFKNLMTGRVCTVTRLGRRTVHKHFGPTQVVHYTADIDGNPLPLKGTVKALLSLVEAGVIEELPVA